MNAITAMKHFMEERATRPAGSAALPRTVEESREFADTPHLTGDPEWDAIELEETDPTREPMKLVR